MLITSKSNELIKNFCKLKDKKYREKTGHFLVETEKVVVEAIKNNYEIEYLIVEENKPCTKIDVSKFNTIFVSSEVIKHLSSLVTPQGVIAVVRKKQENSTLSNEILILDNIQNPDNFGAIIRSSVASNFKTIIAINSCDEFSDKVIRASMGNIFRANIIHSNYQDVAKMLKDYTILGADMNGENIFKISSYPQKVALIVGNEGNGLSTDASNLVSKTIAVPMANDVESLNVTVSASIIMFDIFSKTE